MALTPYNKEVITVLSSAASTLDSTILGSGPAVEVVITVEKSPVKYYVNGSTPTTGVTGSGHTLRFGDALTLDESAELSNFKVIAISPTATLYVTYYS